MRFNEARALSAGSLRFAASLRLSYYASMRPAH